ncbi:hypothetical protein [Streptomyces sp. NPDC006879]|uniref:hypothetical protein n=1 Tax=Streptomyces sp. NPDC006879 TaxID=3364767 RepID=UPI0036ADD439
MIMTTPTVARLEPTATAHVRLMADELAQDFTAGRWAPSALEIRITDILLTATAGDGALTGPRIRAALWEGSFTFTAENGGRLATLLACAVPLVSEPELKDAAVVETVHELLTRVCDRAKG